jgi:hypothetical protein
MTAKLKDKTMSFVKLAIQLFWIFLLKSKQVVIYFLLVHGDWNEKSRFKGVENVNPPHFELSSLK